MKVKDISAIAPVGMPLYEMREVFKTGGSFDNVKMSVITINPGVRVPVSGTGSHAEDEYSIFIDGEVYTESGAEKCVVGAGMATLIPKGEAHWCENRTDKPCKLVCVMVK